MKQVLISEELMRLWEQIAEVLLKDPHNDKMRMAFRKALDAFVAQAQQPAVEPDFWTACGWHEDRWTPLPSYSSGTHHGVEVLVLDAARKEGFKGGIKERLDELGWEIRPVYLAAQSAPQAQPAPVQEHWSDCATNNEPAYPAGDCDCMPTPAMCRAAVEFMNGADVYEKVPREALDIEEGIYRGVWVAMQGAAHQPAPVQEPAKKLWLQRGVFPDLADFDTNGLPRFYSKESADKFQIGQCSKPCAGKNCGSMNGWMHSIECRAEHDAVITAPQARPAERTAQEQQPVAWEVVHKAVCDAVEKCKSASGMHRAIEMYVNTVQITHDALGTDTAPKIRSLK